MTLPLIIIGIVLIAVGLVSFAYQGITDTNRETMLNLGPIKATTGEPRDPGRARDRRQAVQTTAVSAALRIRRN